MPNKKDVCGDAKFSQTSNPSVQQRLSPLTVILDKKYRHSSYYYANKYINKLNKMII